VYAPTSSGRDVPQRAQHLHLLVAHAVGVERRRRLHRQHHQQLQQVVLDDVARDAGLLVEAPAPLDADVLGHRDLHVVDVVAVPQWLEDRVREPEREDVLHGLLAEVVVDAEDLALVAHRVDRPVERARRREVRAQRLLDHDAAEARGVVGVGQQPRGRELREDRAEALGRDGEVEEPVAARAARGVDLLEPRAQARERRRVVVAALDPAHALREVVPHGLVERAPAREPRRRLALLLAEGVVGRRAARVAHDAGARPKEPRDGEVVHRGDELAARQVARRSEDHHDAGRRDTLGLEAHAQRVRLVHGRRLCITMGRGRRTR
jgi:hypothetical protein